MTTTTPAPPVLNGAGPRLSRRRRAARWARWARDRGIRAANRVAAWRWAPALPGVAGVVLTSMAAGGVVGEAVNWLFGLWAGVGLLGLFLLRIDHRLPPPRMER